LLLFSGIIALNVKLIAIIFPTVKSCCFIADKVKLPWHLTAGRPQVRILEQ